MAPASRFVALLVAVGFALSCLSCAAVFPELATKFDRAPPASNLDPPPPPDRHFVRVVSGKVPPRTRDGREWDKAFGSLPDPYVKILVNGQDVMKTPSVADTLEPTWTDEHGENHRVAVGDRLEVQIWDANTLNDGIIGKRERTLSAEDFGGNLDLTLSGDCSLTIELAPARAIWGAGFWYELRKGGARITRLVDSSPATRAGMQRGDEIVKLDGKEVAAMSVDEVRSTLGAIPMAGLSMSLKHADGSTLEVVIKEGPIYPLRADYDQLPVKP